MTNAEKYLKDGTNIDEFTFRFDEWHIKNSDVKGYGEALFRFLNAPAKPILTEDERVILRNIRNDEFCKYIGRGDSLRENTPTNYNLYLRGNDESKAYAIGTIYNHLFQFIKERRRIRDKGVTR